MQLPTDLQSTAADGVAPHSGTTSFEQGFNVAGPVVRSFLTRVHSAAMADRVDLVLFCGPAAYRLHNLFVALPNKRLTSTALTYRLADLQLIHANYVNIVDYLPAWANDAVGLTMAEYLQQLGIPAPSSTFLAELGFSDVKAIASRDFEATRRFLYAYRWEILKVGREKRHRLLLELRSKGIASGMRIAILDLSSAGKEQSIADDLLNSVFDIFTLAYVPAGSTRAGEPSERMRIIYIDARDGGAPRSADGSSLIETLVRYLTPEAAFEQLTNLHSDICAHEFFRGVQAFVSASDLAVAAASCARCY